MPTTIKFFRAMSRMGIFADRDGRDPQLTFRRYNLIYGFNGSGKSTLSRMFASIQAGARVPRLPADCSFEMELDDGMIVHCPDGLSGLEQRILVFNSDFVENSLQWSSARANPVFYIGTVQAALADELNDCQTRLEPAAARKVAAASAIRSADKVILNFRRDRAREIAVRLHLRGRQYEAPQLIHDLSALTIDDASILTDASIDALSATTRKEAPPARLSKLEIDLDGAAGALGNARAVCEIAPSTDVLLNLKDHPEMLIWVTEGHEYHEAHNLGKCLFCDGPLARQRLQAIQKAIDGGIDRVLSAIDEQREIIEVLENRLNSLNPPASSSLNSVWTTSYNSALEHFAAARGILQQAVNYAADQLDKKRRTPSTVPDVPAIPNERDATRLVEPLQQAIGELNKIIEFHNKEVEDFSRIQDEARLAIRKHYVAEARAEYFDLSEAQRLAQAEVLAAASADQELRARIRELEASIREHGPAADFINRLLRSYLGHSELTIVAVSEGYEIHRHGRLVAGVPSEGEKTAIALCYFLSMIESEGRKTKDLIVVVDDPISSLDSRSLNFACTLIRSRLGASAQLFVLTHNLSCVNEFRKAWKSKARTDDGNEPTAALLFLDVSMPPTTASRKTKIMELPPLLREYDFEYHYLFSHILKFATEGGSYDYAYMMPNVLRRVLEVFLAFRCPGTAPLTSKMDQLYEATSNLDRDRMGALERLTQVESHSDNLDDLISFSSMTLEETRDATEALLDVMKKVDEDHLNGLKKICRRVKSS